MSDQPANINLRLALDQAALNQSAAGVDKMQKELADLRASVQDTGSTADKSVGDTGKAFDYVSYRAAEATKQVKELNSALAATAQSADAVGKSGGSAFSGVGTYRRAVGAASNLGVPQEIIRPLQIAGDIGQIGKALDNFDNGLKGLLKTGGPATEAIQQLGGSLGVITVAGGLAVAALGAIVIAGAAFKNTLDQASQGLADAVTRTDDYYKAIEKGTTDSINALLKEQQITQAIEQSKVDQLQRDYDAAHPKLTGNESAASAAITAIFSDLSGGGKQLNKDLEDSKKALKDTSINIDALKDALNSTQVATNNAAEAEKEIQVIRDQNAEKTVNQARQDAQLIATGTSKGVEAQIADIEAAKQAIDKIDFSKLSTGEADKLKQQWTDLDKQEKDLTANVLPLITAREAEAQRIKDTTKALAEQVKAGDDYEKAITAENDARAKNADAITKINENADQARADLEQSYADKRIDIARKAVETAQTELNKLQQKQEDLATGLSRNLSADTVAQQNKILDLQINFQRQEVGDLQQHLQNLQQIRNADASRQRDDQLNRNYRDLFALGEQKNQDISNENDRYQKQEEQRVEALKQQGSDEARAAAIQRQQRLVAYAQAQADATLAYQRQLQQDEVSKQRQLQDAQIADQRSLNQLTTKVNRELAIQAQSDKAQLALLEQTELDKLQILKNAQAATSQLMQGATGGSGGGQARPTPYAAGGRISAFQAAVVNEPGSSGHEGFNGVPFPPGQGLFMPFKSGNINPNVSNSKSVIVNLTVNTNSTDRGLVDLIHGETRRAVLEAVA